jgi:hypothetical protein
MNRAIALCVLALVLPKNLANAQVAQAYFPSHLIIARHTFFDFGPPNDFYEIIDVAQSAKGLAVQRALVTPPGIACAQPATVELSSGVLRKTIQELLQSKNPCAIPEKELHRERQRCKNCLVFGGVDLTMQVSCSGSDRQIRTDILDRDLFDPRAGTPKNTSWSLAVLQQLDSALGPGAMDKPIFPVGTNPSLRAGGDLVDQILTGSLDSLFGQQTKVSAIA